MVAALVLAALVALFAGLYFVLVPPPRVPVAVPPAQLVRGGRNLLPRDPGKRSRVPRVSGGLVLLAFVVGVGCLMVVGAGLGAVASH